MMKNVFYLLHLKSSFRSQDIQTFVLTFHHIKNPLDQKNNVNFKIYDVMT